MFFLGLQLLLALTTEATEYFSWIVFEAYEYSINLLFCYLFHEGRINMATEFLNMKAILEFIVLSKKDPLRRPWLNSKSSGVCSDTRIYMRYPR